VSDARLSRLSRLAPLIFMVAAWTWLALAIASSPPPRRADQEFRIEPAQGALLGAWLGHPAGGLPDGWLFAAGEIRTDFAIFTYRRPATGDEARIELHHRDALGADAVARTARFALRLAPGSRPAPSSLIATLATSLRANESAWHWLEAERHPTPSWLRRVLHLQLPATWFLMLQMPLWLGLAFGTSVRSLRALPAQPRRAVIAATLAAAVVRWLIAPHRLVSLYVGYQLTAQAIALHPLPRYGAATALFHHLFLRAIAPDHRVILWLHSVLGVLLVPFVATMASAAFDRAKDRPYVGVAAAWIWALLPPVIAHDNSEANSVPLLLWCAAGLVLWFDGVCRQDASRLTGGAALLALAMLGRPELSVLVPAAAIVFAAFAITTGRSARAAIVWLARASAPLLAAIAALSLPHLAHVSEGAAVLARFGSLPLGHAPVDMPIGLADPALYPVLLVPIALLGASSPRATCKAGLALLALAGLDVLLTRIDLDRANILRVQVPGALFYVLVAGAGFERAATLATRFRRARAAIVVALGVAVAASAIRPMRTAFRPTNEDLEEAFVREVRAALPPGPLDLVRLGYADREEGAAGSPAHLYFPDYLFASPDRRVTDISDWERAGEQNRRAAFFYLGVRCYTPERPWASRARGELRPVCARFLSTHRLTPMLERTVMGRGDPFHTQYYPDPPTPMRLALYRIER
jgi:hypothetical protein